MYPIYINICHIYIIVDHQNWHKMDGDPRPRCRDEEG